MAEAASGGSWMEDATWSEGTSPSPEESVPGVSPAVLAAVVIGVLATMSLLFSFALLIDCRNQHAEGAKRQPSGTSGTRAARRRRRGFTLPAFFRGRGANGDSLAFASQVCEGNRSTDPVGTDNSSTIVDITEPTPSSSSIIQC